MGIKVRDVHFPQGGGALSVILQVEPAYDAQVTDALLAVMGSSWTNTKMVVAVDPDIDIYDYRDVYYALATRVDPSRDVITIPNARGSSFDPSATPLEGAAPDTAQTRSPCTVGKWGINATKPAPYRAGAQELRSRLADRLGRGETGRLHRHWKVTKEKRTSMSVIDEKAAPVPVDQVKEEGESQAFIPYPEIGKNLEHVPIHVRPDVALLRLAHDFLPQCDQDVPARALDRRAPFPPEQRHHARRAQRTQRALQVSPGAARELRKRVPLLRLPPRLHAAAPLGIQRRRRGQRDRGRAAGRRARGGGDGIRPRGQPQRRRRDGRPARPPGPSTSRRRK